MSAGNLSSAGQWACPFPINLYCHRSLQQRYRKYDSVMSSETQQDSFYSAERTVFDSHPLPNLNKRPGFRGKPGFNCGLDGSDLLFVDRHQPFACSHHMNNTRDRQHCESVQRIELTEDVSREKRQLNLPKSVRPPMLLPVERRERFQSPDAQMPGN